MPLHVHSLGSGSTGASGGGAGVDNRKPYLSMHYIIALVGAFPFPTRRELGKAGAGWNASSTAAATSFEQDDGENGPPHHDGRSLQSSFPYLGSIALVAFDFAPSVSLSAHGVRAESCVMCVCVRLKRHADLHNSHTHAQTPHRGGSHAMGSCSQSPNTSRFLR